MRAYRRTHPLKGEARRRMNCRSYLHVYVRRGKVKKGPCEVCGSKAVEAHHDDYDKPLEVRWLCKKHHRAHHKAEVMAGMPPR